MKRLALQLACFCCAGWLSVASVRAEAQAAPSAATSEESANANVTPVDLNTASAAQLEQLPGIGPSRAQAIVAFREAHGGFTQVGQLMRIKGIGRAMLRKLRPHVMISPVATNNESAQTSPQARHRLP